MLEDPLPGLKMPPDVRVEELVAAEQEGKRTELGRQQPVCPRRLGCLTGKAREVICTLSRTARLDPVQRVSNHEKASMR